ncbi:hypothetical protein [Nesterenkonia sp. NBAIMH1]|uniref:hypothetical protein n=1 Tax=Nesterenkonia sp. NBAIMH1 TaxID=2600320 RepID=UPI0011B4F12A|nr:hypothetical protein [Nesterenkonia sp. NBAIMH1]
MTALFALLAARSLTAPMPSAASAHRTTDADASFSHLLGAAAQDGAADAEEAPTIQRHAPLSERDAEAGSQQTTDDVPASSERALFVSLRPGGGESPPSAAEKAPAADRIDVPAGSRPQTSRPQTLRAYPT